jgi:hypothetical protein
MIGECSQRPTAVRREKDRRDGWVKAAAMPSLIRCSKATLFIAAAFLGGCAPRASRTSHQIRRNAELRACKRPGDGSLSPACQSHYLNGADYEQTTVS